MRIPALASATLAACLLAGCRDAQVASYRIPKDSPNLANNPHAMGNPHGATPPSGGSPGQAPAPGPMGGADMASTPVATAQGPGLTWTAPSAWESRPASGMRKGTLIATGEGGATAELAITAFPGDVGGELANVNRWRSQLGLGPVTEAELPGILTRTTAHGLTVVLVDIPGGANNTRLLGAMVPFQGSTWFFKFTGPAALIERERAAFLQFTQTLQAP